MIKKIGCITDKRPKSSTLKQRLIQELNFIDLEKQFVSVDLIIVCGGDGTLLHTIHNYMNYEIPFYGVNLGNIGFLMNKDSIFRNNNKNNILEKLNHLQKVKISPLKMTVEKIDGSESSAIAINEVSILRKTHQTAHLEITVNDIIEMKQLVADGILVSTPAGSTAYNFSAGGPILPLDANLLALTPISPFRPRRWRGALLSQSANITIKAISPSKRPINAVADFIEFQDVKKVNIAILRNKKVTLMFDQYKTLEDRINKEQFST